MYNYLIVGAGPFGSIFVHQATLKGKKCLAIDRLSHVGHLVIGSVLSKAKKLIKP